MAESKMKFELEFPLRTIIAFGQLWKRQGNDPSQVELDELVAGVVNSLVPWFESRGWIAQCDPDEEVEAFIGLFGREPPGVEPDSKLVINLEDMPSAGGTIPQDDIDELQRRRNGDMPDSFETGERVEAAVQAKLRDKELEVTARPTEPTVVADIPAAKKCDLLKVNRMDIDQLRMLSPKDTIINNVIKGVGDPVYRAAVEIIYTSLPPDLWGTKTAEQAIADMVARHEESK